MKNLFVLSLVWFLTGCVDIVRPSVHPLNVALRNYESIKVDINLGDKIKNVVPKLNQAMANLHPAYRKQPDQYIKQGVKVEIYYARTGWQSDGFTTDDEFTPYIFNNGILVAIGWRTIGGGRR